MCLLGRGGRFSVVPPSFMTLRTFQTTHAFLFLCTPSQLRSVPFSICFPNWGQGNNSKGISFNFLESIISVVTNPLLMCYLTLSCWRNRTLSATFIPLIADPNVFFLESRMMGWAEPGSQVRWPLALSLLAEWPQASDLALSLTQLLVLCVR